MKLGFGKEWKELKKFEKLSLEERTIVFYAENRASINHFHELIHSLTIDMNYQVCYVTSFENDPLLESDNPKIKSFYIGNGTIRTKFFIYLKAKILIMDMPDLGIFHIKRSKVHPVHYVYLFHSMFSIHSYLRKNALDNYDTIFCVGQHHIEEIRKIEEMNKMPRKNLIGYGFGRLDTLLDKKNNTTRKTQDRKLVIIAPSYGETNLLQECGISLINNLLQENFLVLLRPHFRIFQESPDLIKSIKEKFCGNSNFIFEEGIISFENYYNSQCLITDWSGISMEYSFVFERPVIFIDTPKKIINTDINQISMKTIESDIREEIGYVISPKNIDKVLFVLNSLDEKDFSEQIKKIRNELVFNIGKSSKTGVKYIEELIKTDKIE